TIAVLEGGTQTTVQDFPGRLGHWDVGVPPSGPMDALAFRLANRLAGNPASAAGLEITLAGPMLTFNTEAVIALTGADTGARLDEVAVEPWRAIRVKRGQTLRCGTVQGAGMRAYLAVRHGFDVPDYLGSKSTFTLGLFGGHAGRAIRTGDVLRINAGPVFGEAPAMSLRALPPALVPAYAREWEIAVLYGPHGAPDFFQ